MERRATSVPYPSPLATHTALQTAPAAPPTPLAQNPPDRSAGVLYEAMRAPPPSPQPPAELDVHMATLHAIRVAPGGGAHAVTRASPASAEHTPVHARRGGPCAEAALRPRGACSMSGHESRRTHASAAEEANSGYDSEGFASFGAGRRADCVALVTSTADNTEAAALRPGRRSAARCLEAFSSCTTHMARGPAAAGRAATAVAEGTEDHPADEDDLSATSERLQCFEQVTACTQTRRASGSGAVPCTSAGRLAALAPLTHTARRWSIADAAVRVPLPLMGASCVH